MKEDFQSQIKRGLNDGHRERNAAKVVFYFQLQNKKDLVASASFEQFKGSHLWDKWLKENESEIEQLANYNAQFSGYYKTDGTGYN